MPRRSAPGQAVSCGYGRRFDRCGCSHYVPTMAAANASARGQRVAILASPLHELAGFLLAVDCLAPGCNGRAHFRHRGTGELLWPGLYCGPGAAANALFRNLRRPCRGSVAGNRPDPQYSRQAPTCAAVGAGGEGVASPSWSDVDVVLAGEGPGGGSGRSLAGGSRVGAGPMLSIGTIPRPARGFKWETCASMPVCAPDGSSTWP
jgi:hypothetical protein